MERAYKKHSIRTVGVLVAACVLIVGSATAAYAMDLGGIQRTLQLWIQGDRTEATITFDGKGNYNVGYSDAEGNSKEMGGGGVALNDDGTETPLSEEELMELLMAPDVEYKDDGTVWVYWFDQKVEITDKFENEVCYVQLVSGEDTIYLTIKYQNGFATSPDKYLSPSAFN